MFQEEARLTVKRSNPEITEAIPYLVAIDVGFGGTKYISNFTKEARVIPSMVVSGQKTSSKLFELSTVDEDNLIITTEDGTHFVGNQALNIPTSGSKRTQVRDRASDTMSRVLFKTGIGMALPHKNGEYDVHVVTGLPNDDYDLSIREHLSDFLGKSFTVEFHLSETKSIKKTIHIVHHEILRQPEGAVTYNQFQFDKEQFLIPSSNARNFVGIIDFGHFTTDFALFQDGVIIENDFMNESTVGVTEVYNKLRRKLIVKFDKLGYEYRATDKDLDIAIRTGTIFYMNRDHDVTEEVAASAKEVASTIAKAILDAWGNETNRLEMIIISGGGSHVFSEALSEEFKARKKQGFQFIDTPQFSNVLGFYMYGAIALSDLFIEETIYQHYVEPIFAEYN